ncbi:MAG: hypothetical protein HN646_09560 [Nitrospina sp.]|nr:hypothetical protein [Nitrospina sp.]MBT7522506.1 hypothetical protein [Nitrospina sp.]
MKSRKPDETTTRGLNRISRRFLSDRIPTDGEPQTPDGKSGLWDGLGGV